MKVLFVNEKGWFMGGVERFVNDAAAGLATRGHEVHLLTSDPAPSGRSPLDAPFSSRSRLELAATPEARSRQLDRVLASSQPDVLFVHRWNNRETLRAAVEGRRTIRYVHDHDIYCPRRHKYFPLSKTICTEPLGFQCVVHGCLLAPRGPIAGLPGLINIVEKRRDLQFNRTLPRLLVGSQWMRREMLRNGFADNQLDVVAPIPAGLEREPVAMGTTPLVLFVGQIVRGKGVDLLIEALATVRHDFHAIVVGTGNQMRECVELTRKLKLSHRVTFAGWVDHEKLATYYSDARVIVVPSRWAEPFGMVGLEAMWSARPVVAFSVGGIPDWLADGETGLLAPPADVVAFGNALDEILGDHDRAARMGIAGWARAREHYKFEDFVSQIERALETAPLASAHVPAEAS